MNWRLIASLSLLAAVVLGNSTAPRAADESKAAPQTHLVAVLDYESVLQKSPRYQAALEKLKSGTTTTENEFKTLNELVHRMEDDLKSLIPGSPDYLKRRAEDTLKKHELRALIQIERAKFEEQRVQLEARVSHEIDEITKRIAVANNIALVLNQDSREQPLRDLEATQRYRQRQVVYHNPGFDITPLIFHKWNEGYNESAKASKAADKRTCQAIKRRYSQFFCLGNFRDRKCVQADRLPIFPRASPCLR